MGKIQALIEVNVPISTAYNQWTQFEEFPRFMDGIESVKQLDDRTLEWHANIAAMTKRGRPTSPSRSPTTESRGIRPPALGTTAWSRSSESTTTKPA